MTRPDEFFILIGEKVKIRHFALILKDGCTMKKPVVGILAHVDAGKTTLSEALLYCGGTIRNMGRVDHQDA